MKLNIIHLWIFACVDYGFAIIMAFQGRLAASILFTMIYLFPLIITRWITNNGETKAHHSYESIIVNKQHIIS